jgi:hypothetical protein
MPVVDGLSGLPLGGSGSWPEWAVPVKIAKATKQPSIGTQCRARGIPKGKAPLAEAKLGWWFSFCKRNLLKAWVAVWKP